MKKILVLSCLFLASLVHAEPQIKKVTMPLEVRQEMTAQTTDDPDLVGKQWNRWTTKNFVVCSLNDTQAQYLFNHLEYIKKWIFSRWGLQDFDFNTECRLICVDDKNFYKKLFGIETSKVEIRKDSSGKVTLCVIFLLCDQSPANALPSPLTEACLDEMEQKQGIVVPWCFHRGMALLNNTLPIVRQNVRDFAALGTNHPLFYSKNLLTMNEEMWNKQTPEARLQFDRESMLLCLMLRKEFGQEKFVKFFNDMVSKISPDIAMKNIYGYANCSDFDVYFKKFITDITNDITGISGRQTPDSYLQINPKSR